MPDLVAKVRTGIVRVETRTCDAKFIGTGFLLAPNLVGTVEHVIDGATEITLRQNGKTLGTATVIGLDPARDLALLRTDRPLQGYKFTLASRPPRLGESVVALGYPLGLPLTVTRGLVSGQNRTILIEGIARHKLVQTDAAVNHGNSGGPLISTDTGDVVGLVDLGTTEANGVAFAVSAQVARPLLAAWRVAPQPSANPGCGAPPLQAAPVPQPTTSPSLANYNGTYFSVSYPAAWRVEAAEQPKSDYYDTTVRSATDPALLLRVDVKPNAPANVDAAARPVVQGLERQPGYRQLGYQHTTLAGHDAVYWEFLVEESGRLLHKVDVFFVDSAGNGFGVLTQAPADSWAQWVPTFNSMLGSVVPYGG